MDTKKLEKWAELLLDTGKRNNLINFKDTKYSTAEVLLPNSDAVLERINSVSFLEVFDPKIEEDEEVDSSGDQTPEEELESISEELSQKESFLAQYANKIKRQNQILIYSSSSNPLLAIRNIDKKARSYVEETGVNVAYMAFGFVHWKESDSSNRLFRAPLLLAPINISQESVVAPYHIKSAEDDIIVNPTFSFKLEVEYGIKLPEYREEGLKEYLENVRQLVSKLSWTVTQECKIGIFSFLKINMYRDLKDNAAAILANDNVRRLLGELTKEDALYDAGGKCVPLYDPLIELHNVVDADSSQIDAIEMAKSGKSFVLQGPPGTGKSQTITNIIAECLGDGKKVLFVSEKLAALNVVYEKLKNVGLSEFCLELHSHKANKKAVIADLCHTLRAEKSAVSAKADTEIAIKENVKRQLDAYAYELHKKRPIIEKSLYQLYEAYAGLRHAPDVDWAVPQIGTKGDVFFREANSLLEQCVNYFPSVGYDYRKNPWYGYIGQDISYQAKVELRNQISAVMEFLQKLIPLTQEVSEKYGIQCISVEDAVRWKEFFDYSATSRLITPALLNKERFEKARRALNGLHTISNEIHSCRAVLDAVFDEDVYKLDGASCFKKLRRHFDSTVSRLFNAEYKQLVSDFRLCKKDGKKVSYDEAVSMSERLAYYQRKCEEYCEVEAQIQGFLAEAYNGINTDWGYITAQISGLNGLLSQELSFGRLTDFSDFSSERQNFFAYAKRFDAVFSSLDDSAIKNLSRSYSLDVFNLQKASCRLAYARLSDCLAEMDKLDNWCHFRRLLSLLEKQQIVSYVDIAIGNNIEPDHIVEAFQKLFYYQWIDLVLSQTPVLTTFDRISQDKAIKTFVQTDIEQFEISKAKIRAELSAKRPALDLIASGSSLAILLREGEKKWKQKNIRPLLIEIGELVQRIKPCFLMSPLSVSTYLAPESVHFDVVIFDEASQIFPQDAVGAIYRAKQLIIVGDSKQMPPSNFFNATVDAESDDEETGDITDFESILDLCATSLQQLRLRWHYRSRYEQLIAFSNKNFYDNDLVTFPSAKSDTQGVGVDYYHVDGIYDRKSHTNRKEAEFVVELIYQNIEKYPERSLGVVAFSVAQQDLIDKLLSKRRLSNPEKEIFFKKDGVEPFFVKNLETVQGDERDTIIFSVAYGVDSQGRLLHNFGPLNRVGGERRLNVAVTRAKCNVQLVSSMHYTDIDLKRTSAEGARLLREYLDYAENGNIALERTIRVNAYEQFDSDFELEVCEFLRANGFTVDTQVGCSGFKIDLGLKIPNSSDYVLAIECDGASYHSSKNARDRDRLRQEILERMGWRFYRIWSTDWFRNKSAEQQRLLEAATEAVSHPEEGKDSRKDKQSSDSFEVITLEKPFAFLPYKSANIDKICSKHRCGDFVGIVRDILEVEAPLSEELLLKRMVWFFGREKVTSVVQREYENLMFACHRYGIIRRNGFLYLENRMEIQFRCSDDAAVREIKYIAPEELAAGMYSILKQNVTADKNGLYRLLASQCGVSRVGKAVNESFDAALSLLKNYITMEGDQLSLK